MTTDPLIDPGETLKAELDADEERRLVNLVAQFHDTRREEGRWQRESERLTAQFREWFTRTGESEIWDGEHSIGVGFGDGRGSRAVAFDELTAAAIVEAARRGLFSLNATAYDGALASNDQALRDAARAIASKVYMQGGGYDPDTGKGGAVVLLPKRGES